MMGSFYYEMLRSDYISKDIFGFRTQKPLSRGNRNALAHIVEKQRAKASGTA